MNSTTLWIYTLMLCLYGLFSVKELAEHSFSSGWASLIIFFGYSWIVIQLANRALILARIEWYIKEKQKIRGNNENK